MRVGIAESVEDSFVAGGEEGVSESRTLLKHLAVGSAQQELKAVAMPIVCAATPINGLLLFPCVGRAHLCLPAGKGADEPLPLRVVLLQSLQKALHAATPNTVKDKFVRIEIREFASGPPTVRAHIDSQPGEGQQLNVYSMQHSLLHRLRR